MYFINLHGFRNIKYILSLNVCRDRLNRWIKGSLGLFLSYILSCAWINPLATILFPVSTKQQVLLSHGYRLNVFLFLSTRQRFKDSDFNFASILDFITKLYMYNKKLLFI